MKALLLLLLLPCFAYAQLSQFNFYEPVIKPKTDTVNSSQPFTPLIGYLDSGTIMWTADTIHWIPSQGMVGREITGYYFDEKTKSYLKR